MPHIPLDSDQEKLLYIAGIIGMKNALELIEDDVRSKYSILNSLTKLKRIK